MPLGVREHVTISVTQIAISIVPLGPGSGQSSPSTRPRPYPPPSLTTTTPLSRAALQHSEPSSTSPIRLPATPAERHISRGAPPSRDDVSLADHYTRSSAYQHAPPCHYQAALHCPYRDSPNQGTRSIPSRSRR